MYKRVIGILLCVVLLLGMAVPVCAVETEDQEEILVRELEISTVEEFLAFAENCRLDSYSQNLAVTLENDIDLQGIQFRSIPYFSGSFDGKGHIISGLNITESGSVQGLFRYLTATASVQDLNVIGEIHPSGSRGEVGAIAGQNGGLISNCSFSGSISGGDHVGGLVGVNTVTGIIDKCRVSGDIYGDHFVGGIAGENTGVIRNCLNSALINTTPQQNSIDIADITLDNLTNTESVNTVTDIGGIAGISSGVIRSCLNTGDVGYQHMGYNIGGIAGTQSGYVVDCENQAEVQGRKEVGGIVGQMEPVTTIAYTEDTLQILQEQLDTMSGMVNRTASNAQGNANEINDQIGALQDQTETARDAVDTLLPDEDHLEIPDSDTILAAQNALSTSLSAMPGTLNNIASATQATMYGLFQDLNALSGQISAMSETIDNASENLGGSITDISDLDTEELLTGKIANCRNIGAVLAELNVGGIVGAMAMENDLDILQDWEQRGEESLNFQSEVRAVVLDCENQGVVIGKKQNVGGIAGWQSLGLVKNCTNTGKVDGENADYVGGISGMSTGYIRADYAKCEITANTYAGGIAGSATVVTDCISMVLLENVREKAGAILGGATQSETQDEEMPISGNIYPEISRDVGAIDGISYSGIAEPMTLEAFLNVENLPETFRTVTLRFLFEDGTERRLSVQPGGAIMENRIPHIPEKEGFTATWEGLDQVDLENLVFSMTFEAVYISHRTTIQSQQTRENGLPLLLLEGVFPEQATVDLSAFNEIPALSKGETLLECWKITATQPGKTARFLLSENVDAENVRLMVYDLEGIWEIAPHHVDGSYLVFDANQEMVAIALVQLPENDLQRWLIGGCALTLALAVILVYRKKRRQVNPVQTEVTSA